MITEELYFCNRGFCVRDRILCDHGETPVLIVDFAPRAFSSHVRPGLLFGQQNCSDIHPLLTNMASELIVDFPLKRNHNHDVVRFAETAQLYIVDRHEDKNELWYTKAEYNSMRRNQARCPPSSYKRSDVQRRWRLLDWRYLSSNRTGMYARGASMQMSMRACSPHRAGEAGPIQKFRSDDIALASLR